MKILDVRRVLIVVALLIFVACSGSSFVTSTFSRFSVAAANDNTAVNGPVRGNKTSKIYHWPGCPEYDKMTPEHIVEFPDAAAAEAAGYRAARNCPKAGNANSRKPRPAQPPSAQPATTPLPISQPTPNPRSDITNTTKTSRANKNVNTSSDTSTNSNARVKSSKANKNANTSNDATNNNARVKSSKANKNVNSSTDVTNSNARVKVSNGNKNANISTDATDRHPRVKVWVNTDSGIYECSGAAFYGKTKNGVYMTQGAAQKKGFHPAGNKICQ